MSGRSSIPDATIELLAALYSEANPATGKRWTLRELGAHATKLLGREVTRQSVERAIYPVRAEWARAAREVTRERIALHLSEQVSTLDTMLMKTAEDFASADGAKERAAALDTYHKGLALKLRYSGVGEAIELSGALDVTSDGKPIAAMTTDELRAHIATLRARVEPEPG